MTTKFNKSEILKRAWKLFKNQDVRTDEMFGICLKNSWAIAKSVPEFNTIYKQYYNEIYNFINMKIHNSDNAQELTNDVFIKANENLSKYNNEISKIRTWLYNIARNTVIDHFRTDHSDKYINVNTFVDDNGKEMYQFADSCNTADMVENLELSAKINSAMDNLKPKYKRVAELYFLQDKPYNEISDLLELPLGSVKGMINRVRTMLQSDLKPAYQSI